MNRIKRACALLLAVILALGVAFQPGIGGAFAESTERSEQVTAPATEPATESTTEPATEPETGPATEPATEPETEPATEPEGETEASEASPVLSFYEQLMACVSLTDFDALLRAEENGLALAALSQEELTQLLARVEELYASIAQPTEADTLLKETLLEKLMEYITVICPECGGEDGVHNEGCSAFDPVCSCGSEDGVHSAECPLYVPTVCPECGETDGHGESCSQYAAEPPVFPWVELSDTELAAWLMDEANAETVKAILSGEGEEYESLNARIDAILSGEDEELAQQLQEYLSALLGLDQPTFLVADGTICFDLAAGDVSIGSSKYSGFIYVKGEVKPVTGDHKAENKYYIYQSTDANKETTGYTSEDNLKAKIGCQVPAYDRVKNEETLWYKYITNKADVYAVIDNWKAAATAAKRTETKHRIIFTAGATYDVTIDNIWSNYHIRNVARTTGGITAHLGYNKNTIIQLKLKGDNRFGNIHYYAEENTKNQIIFSDGEGGADPGSITVADFPEDRGANYWCSAIGGNDNGYDPSDGIVIKSGVIYAGTTSADDCTAIGGGGNEFGRVTITGGTVTAVTASTGTAIGGGIGWGDVGGNADVTITGGHVYAYNHGIGPDSGSYVSFVPAAAIGGGSASTNNGNKRTVVTISGGYVYAQSVAGTAIGGGGSGTKKGGDANVTISGGTVIAKSVGKKVSYNKNYNPSHTEEVFPGVSIGGGTGATGGGDVTLTINTNKGNTVLRTGSIGGGKCTGSGNIGSAKVTISGGDITGQVIMAKGATSNCSFEMSGGRIHGTDVVHGNTVTDVDDPQQGTPISYLEDNGGAVWMQDPNGIATVTGGTIENCSAYLGGAIYMEGGKFTLSGSGTIRNNNALRGDGTTLQGYGGGVYVTNGNAEIKGGSISENSAQIRGGGIYLTGGDVTVSGGLISKNTAGFGDDLPANVGRGGGVYLEGTGKFTMDGGEISGNHANYRGGGIFLTKKPTLTNGTISGNTANDSGGGLCVNGDQVELKSPEMKIYGNNAKNGGGVAVLNGDFILDGGAVGVEGEEPNTATKGGGVYVEAEAAGGGAAVAANATVKSGNVWYNKAAQGGGIYLAAGEGDFTLDGPTASISHNTATNGGGIYLYKDPMLNQGRIEQNNADENGGGMYISDCLVTLNPEKDVTITGNGAKNGAGIYIHGNSVSSTSSIHGVDAVTSATPTHRVGLLVDSNFAGTVRFTDNVATESGGAVCVNVGRFQQESNNITVTGNRAKNGGGVAVLQGNFTMIKGSIGEKNGANHATNGGGVYVSSGEIWLKGGSVEYNEATYGGGAYVTGGRFIMVNGSLANNEASEKGGGGYVAGDFRMLGGTVGGEGSGNTAKSGGGFYVSEGNVTVVYGIISHNHATGDGGGFYVSAANNSVKVLMLSGSLSSNQAKGNGGGMAVESNNAQTISVEIGCLLNHNVKDGSPTLPIPYEGSYQEYAHFDSEEYTHGSCPEVKDNKAGNIGGGFYLDSESSTLSFYCVEESGNTAAQGKENSEGMDVEGGKVIIGDKNYHNYEYDQSRGENKQNVPWGYISMDNATLVNGGQVDIYGDMTNPVFRDEVTVDIEDTANDHFIDHRRAHTDEKSYKVHYVENFFGTGLYQAFQYDEGNTVITIEGALYSHPGYEILGWYTKAEYNPAVEDKDNQFYPVGKTFDLSKHQDVPQMGSHATNCTICGTSNNDANLLVLYAIWEANGYTVVFDPNVPQGGTYTGSMEDQIHQYGVKQKLTKNAYQYLGHSFHGWNTQPDGSGTQYADEAEVSNLTDKNGVKVVLYAQWNVCDHSYPERWSYDVIDGGKTLRRICSCGGQTLTATLNAENTVYDGHSHLATLTFNDEAAWGKDKPIIVYTGEWLNEVHTNVESLLPAPDSVPIHAGIYTASITKQGVNETEPVTVSVKYTVAKAEQTPPEKPTYSVNGNEVTINRVANDPRTLVAAEISQQAKAKYRLSHYSGSVLVPGPWQQFKDDTENQLVIKMETALTNYNVEAYYEELNDYKPSEIVRASTVYFYAGDVQIVINYDEGIYYSIEYARNENAHSNGITLTLTTDEANYYLVNGKYTVSAIRQHKPEDGTSPEDLQVNWNETEDVCSLTDIPDHSIVTVTIGTTRKKLKVTSTAAPGQIFSSFENVTTTISRDSAFTAAYQVSNYGPKFTKDNVTYEIYTGLNLTFDQALPQDTTIILLDRRDKSYWYYRAKDGSVRSVPLTAFTKMGGTGTYQLPDPAEENGYVNLDYQFIVDFSQSGGYPGNSLTMDLEAPVKDGSLQVPSPENSAVTVSMVTPTFSLAENTEGTNSLTRSLNCAFNVSATASKWEKRASAVILTPKSDLPPDACIKAEADGGTTYLYKSGDSFIVPLSLLQTEEKTVTLTLQSALFPTEGASYSFTTKWLISPSTAGRAPMIGDQKGDILDVTFTSLEKKAPSLKTTGQARVLTSGDTLKLEIKKANMDGYTISAALLRKSENGTYNGTGWNQTNVTETSLDVPLGGQNPGSFCLKLTVKQKDSIIVVMEVPYYFIIKPTQ